MEPEVVIEKSSPRFVDVEVGELKIRMALESRGDSVHGECSIQIDGKELMGATRLMLELNVDHPPKLLIERYLVG